MPASGGGGWREGWRLVGGEWVKDNRGMTVLMVAAACCCGERSVVVLLLGSARLAPRLPAASCPMHVAYTATWTVAHAGVFCRST